MTCGTRAKDQSGKLSRGLCTTQFYVRGLSTKLQLTAAHFYRFDESLFSLIVICLL